jgi:hypothetical protein
MRRYLFLMRIFAESSKSLLLSTTCDYDFPIVMNWQSTLGAPLTIFKTCNETPKYKHLSRRFHDCSLSETSFSGSHL